MVKYLSKYSCKETCVIICHACRQKHLCDIYSWSMQLYLCSLCLCNICSWSRQGDLCSLYLCMHSCKDTSKVIFHVHIQSHFYNFCSYTDTSYTVTACFIRKYIYKTPHNESVHRKYIFKKHAMTLVKYLSTYAYKNTTSWKLAKKRNLFHQTLMYAKTLCSNISPYMHT